MVIGIPRAFLYHRYRHLWETFFDELNISYLVSPETTREILNDGITHAIDEACLSSKIYLGHVAWLMNRCDAILVPRVDNYGSDGIVCTKFQALYDVVHNTFRENKPTLLDYNIDFKNADAEFRGFIKMGKKLGKKRSTSMRAYLVARQTQKSIEIMETKKLEEQLKASGIKVLLVAHRYNIDDQYIGAPILYHLKELGVTTLLGEAANRKEAIAEAEKVTDTLPWAFNKELVGAVSLYQNKIDGVILISSFPCGPDSLVNEMINRRFPQLPMLNLTLDGQEGSAGMETRLESFIDIIKFKRDDLYV
ncbi:acyl-CoA dehydratase activase-related protein [Tindallia californiensis]|uniref:Predicted nucleotide-binding protein, sugar kinase/HSP70/actin superfamily n=1 Tax=Tindallia californiensis TaxID=159292 RepID=A0A1H3Q6D9_9FIRM|nr:acyl-CoA dehydratase activase-related protein [Tindallia californiensis]SDZ08595.1 Predicted nucleotide-binding protein, sugar kinase/HSP70/actin superfamily [Tindallia californiensis]